MPFIVYILHSHIKEKYYIGYSSNLAERIIRHNQKSKGFTGNVNDWKIVFTQEFATKTEALAREKQRENNETLRRIIQHIPMQLGGSGVRTPFRKIGTSNRPQTKRQT